MPAIRFLVLISCFAVFSLNSFGDQSSKPVSCPSDPQVIADELIRQELDGRALPEGQGCMDPSKYKWIRPRHIPTGTNAQGAPLEVETLAATDSFTIGNASQQQDGSYRVDFIVKLRKSQGDRISHTRYKDSLGFTLNTTPESRVKSGCANLTSFPQRIYLWQACVPR